MLTLVLIEAALALGVYLVARRVGLRPRPTQVPLVLASALPPLFNEIMGQMYRIEPGATPIHPAWAPDALWFAFCAGIAVSLATITLARGYRIPAAAFALPRVPLTWLLGLGGVMQITGVYL